MSIVRYGRRSNWFKIHCLMQQNSTGSSSSSTPLSLLPPNSPSSPSLWPKQEPKDNKNSSFGTSSRSPSPTDSCSEPPAARRSDNAAARGSPRRPPSAASPRPFPLLPLLASSPVKEAARAGRLTPAGRPLPSAHVEPPSSLYSPLWLAGSFFGLSKLSPLLAHHPLLLLQVLACTSTNFNSNTHTLDVEPQFLSSTKN